MSTLRKQRFIEVDAIGISEKNILIYNYIELIKLYDLKSVYLTL